MNKEKWKAYGIWILICEAVGAVSGLLSRQWIAVYEAAVQKPPFTPPSWVFPVVWVILFALMGISAARISLAPDAKDRSRGLNLFVAQLVVNFFWPLFFFNLQAFGFSFIWLLLLWLLVAATIYTFWKVDQTAAWLLAPYFVWLTFAAILNLAVWILNK